MFTVFLHFDWTDPDQSSCFGGPFGNFLTKYFIGYDIMVIASFKNLLPEGMGKYVYSLQGTQNNRTFPIEWPLSIVFVYL